MSDFSQHPVDSVTWVPIEDVQANDYNPNSVAGKEMALLYTSIKHDGYTQPVVTVFDEALQKYVIVDGFHRYFVCKNNPDILESTHGRLPVVVLEKGMNDRMASTVRHNRARGSHGVEGMSSMVFAMLDNGWIDEDICNHLGMGADELLRLKHITGFSKLFEDAEYNKAWVTKRQLQLKKEEMEMGKKLKGGSKAIKSSKSHKPVKKGSGKKMGKHK
jgi:ParB-like chromosome segregation protein Spo0J